MLPLFLELLESRDLPSAVTIDVSQVLRSVNPQLLGVNVNWWDAALNTAQTQQLVQNAGLTLFRFPGGSSSDEWHFNAPPSYNGEGTTASMARFIASVNGGGMVTLNYGTGSPQEAAAFLAYLNAVPTNATPLGQGEQWSAAGSSWTLQDWKTAGYWAGLRAATPLAQDDGFNFLRLGRAAPFGFHFFEVGNEVYGNWETDQHGQGGDPGTAHDPATYVAFARQFAGYASQVDPSISIGLATDSPGSAWTSGILQQCVSQGFLPGFLSDHSYMEAPGQENDAFLLLHTATDSTGQDPNDPLDWAVRATAFRTVLNQVLGSNAARVELLATEFNSVYANPGKQTTSLVNGLFVADSLGALLQTEYNAAIIWGLRNSWEAGNNNSASLYGWRQGGDYGLLGTGQGLAPATGDYVPYPSYFAEQLVAKMVHPGDSVVRASSSDPSLSVYAVHEAMGHLDLLVINKSAGSVLTGSFQITGFQPAGQAQVWQYGKAQDTAQSQTTDGHSALASFTSALSLTGSSFSYSFPAYSMTVLDLGTAPPPVNHPPTIKTSARATPSPVTGQTATLKVLGADDGGEANLTYTWGVTGTPPAPVTFSVNGTNAAKTTTATFSQAGTYSLQVTITDAGGLSIASSVKVQVNQTLSRIVLTPASPSVFTWSTQQFTATALDQFGNPLAHPPSFSWSAAGGGTISSSGLYRTPATPTSVTVQASRSGISGKTAVTVVTNPAAYVQAAFSVVYSWSNGFTANITLTNTGTTSISDWVLQFNFSTTITTLWNATLLSHSGSRYLVQNVSYDATIAPGQSITFGFNAFRSFNFGKPSGYVLNGVPLPGSPGNPA